MSQNAFAPDVRPTSWNQINPLEQARAQLDWVQANAYRFEDGKTMIAKAQAEYTLLRDQYEEGVITKTGEIIAKVQGVVRNI